METIHKIADMKKRLSEWLDGEMNRGKEQLDTKEAGDVADMIKDLAQAEKDCYEAKYYKAVVEAMEESASSRSGYNHRRYSDGQFAPRGRGHISGFHDSDEMMRMYYDEMDENERMGYSRSGQGGRSQSGNNSSGGGSSGSGSSSRYGYSYDNYTRARRHYTESRSPEQKREMDRYANEHMVDTISTMKDIWAHSDPELKKRMKSDLSTLLSEMSM